MMHEKFEDQASSPPRYTFFEVCILKYIFGVRAPEGTYVFGIQSSTKIQSSSLWNQNKYSWINTHDAHPKHIELFFPFLFLNGHQFSFLLFKEQFFFINF